MELLRGASSVTYLLYSVEMPKCRYTLTKLEVSGFLKHCYYILLPCSLPTPSNFIFPNEKCSFVEP